MKRIIKRILRTIFYLLGLVMLALTILFGGAFLSFLQLSEWCENDQKNTYSKFPIS